MRRGSMKAHGLIADNMVIQEGMRSPVWGTAEPGEEVRVTIAGQSASSRADKTGEWRVELGPMKAGGPHEMTIAGKQTLRIRNVMVGEVWVCSGQSNMGMVVSQSMNAEEEVAKADHPEIRLFNVPYRLSEEPEKDVSGEWQVCSPKTAGEFSATAYFFGRFLHRELKRPVGLIVSAVGATPAESWTEIGALGRATADPMERCRREARDIARPAGLWNGMVAPLVGYGIRGVIWYQGESNVDAGREYRKVFPALIESWRKEWGQGDFPFLAVSLANWSPRLDYPSESGWAEVREAQWMTTERLPNCGLAVTIDIGDEKTEHPTKKQEVGRRLGLAALAKAYGKDVVYSGPMYRSMKIEGDRVRVRFKHVDGGLVTKPAGPVKGFAIAGADREFVYAEAKIQGESVVVWSKGVSEPVAVRYGWATNPECNLFNGEGLPAAPFRTDDWEHAGGKPA